MPRDEFYKKCARCNITAAEDPSLTFHRFPLPSTHGITSIRFWAEYCYPDEDWSTEKSLRLLHYKHKMICSKHFSDSCYIDSARTKLNMFAIPTGARNLSRKSHGSLETPHEVADVKVKLEVKQEVKQEIDADAFETSDAIINNPETITEPPALMTSAQTRILCRFFEENTELVRGYEVTPESMTKYNAKWKNITEVLNANGPPRDRWAWSMCLSEIKQNLMCGNRGREASRYIKCTRNDFNEMRFRMMAMRPPPPQATEDDDVIFISEKIYEARPDLDKIPVMFVQVPHMPYVFRECHQRLRDKLLESTPRRRRRQVINGDSNELNAPDVKPNLENLQQNVQDLHETPPQDPQLMNGVNNELNAPDVKPNLESLQQNDQVLNETPPQDPQLMNGVNNELNAPDVKPNLESLQQNDQVLNETPPQDLQLTNGVNNTLNAPDVKPNLESLQQNFQVLNETPPQDFQLMNGENNELNSPEETPDGQVVNDTRVEPGHDDEFYNVGGNVAGIIRGLPLAKKRKLFSVSKKHQTKVVLNSEPILIE